MLFFGNSLFRVGLEWIRIIIFFSLMFSQSRSRFGFRRRPIYVFWFFDFFFLFFWHSLFRVGLEWIWTRICFLSFSASPIPFWLEKKPYWYFLIFWIFFLFFWNSLFQVEIEWIRMIILFFFSHSQSVPSCFGFKRSHIDVFEFFYYFFGIPYSGLGLNGSEW